MCLVSLPELLPDADFRHTLRLRPGNVAAFFQPSRVADTVRRERLHCLTAWRGRHLGALATADRRTGPLFEMFRPIANQVLEEVAPNGSMIELLDWLGRKFEPDILVLERDQNGAMRLVSSCVCFPSGWAPEEKLGLPLDEIHGIVPGLNETIGRSISRFLGNLKTGSAWFRSNWGISASAELNQHPARDFDRLTATTPAASTWLRVEHQLLAPLPDGDALLFGIRLQMFPLNEIRDDAVLRRGLRRALATMPEDMARYKNLLPALPALLAFLE